VRVIWLTLLEQDKLRIRLAVPLFAWHDSYLDLDESRPCLAASDNKALLQVWLYSIMAHCIEPLSFI
jgi:hypothetical protein